MKSAFTIGAGLSVAACVLGCGASTTASGAGVTTTAAAPAATWTAVVRCDVPLAPAVTELEEGVRATQRGELENARRLFARACDADNPCACTELGESFVDPPDGARDIARGATLLARACAGGDVWGCYALGSAIFRFLPERIEEARDLFEDACEDGVPEACLEFGRFRMTGVDGDSSSMDALRFYDRACREGVVYACVVLGEGFALGVGTRPDPERAAELLTWACDEAHVPQACTSWASLLEVEATQRDALLRRACDGGDVIACDRLAPESARLGGEAALRALSTNVPAAQPIESGSVELEATIGGGVDLRSLGLRPTCVGFVGSSPSVVLSVPQGASQLAVRVRAPTDAVLAIRDPAGRWICDDDGVAGDYDPHIDVGEPVQGDYLVWAGTLEPEAALPARLVVAAVAPAAVITPASYDALPQPTSESATMPDLALRYYQLDVTAMPGLTGRVRVDGEEVWSFADRGGHVTLDEVQCALTSGRHVIDVELVARRRDARVLGRAGGLIVAELRGSRRRSQLSEDTSVIHRLEWTPDAPGRRQIVVDVGRRQGADRSTCR